MARIQVLATAAGAVLCAALSACGGAGAGAPVPAMGAQGGACFANDTCLGEFVCAKMVCSPKGQDVVVGPDVAAGQDVVSGQDSGADMAVAPTDPCSDPQTVAILVDDAGTKKLVCAPDYPVWGIGPVTPTGFTDNGDGTVAHALTGLTWQQAVPPDSYDWAAAAGLTWQQAVPPDSYDWAAAEKYCDALTLAGSSAWRLPTRTELLSLVRFATNNPAIDGKAFPATPSDAFWSASPWALGGSAWYVLFDGGYAFYYDTTSTSRVRCVR